MGTTKRKGGQKSNPKPMLGDSAMEQDEEMMPSFQPPLFGFDSDDDDPFQLPGNRNRVDPMDVEDDSSEDDFVPLSRRLRSSSRSTKKKKSSKTSSKWDDFELDSEEDKPKKRRKKRRRKTNKKKEEKEDLSRKRKHVPDSWKTAPKKRKKRKLNQSSDENVNYRDGFDEDGFKKPLPAFMSSIQTGKRASYGPGQHGYKGREQKRLSDKRNPVSGKTHESEHVIGLDVLKGNYDGKRNSTKDITQMENYAPAYQEEKAFHRDHIGTGNNQEQDESGMNARQYRTAQRELLMAGAVGDSHQLNQLGYAFNPDFQKADSKKKIKTAQADDSYDSMIKHTEYVPLYVDGEYSSLEFSMADKKEAYISRRLARGEEWSDENIDKWSVEFYKMMYMDKLDDDLMPL